MRVRFNLALKRELPSVLARCIHMREQRGVGPAIDFKTVPLLIIADRRARFHSRLAVDLVVIVAARRQKFLHAIEVATGPERPDGRSRMSTR